MHHRFSRHPELFSSHHCSLAFFFAKQKSTTAIDTGKKPLGTSLFKIIFKNKSARREKLHQVFRFVDFHIGIIRIGTM